MVDVVVPASTTLRGCPSSPRSPTPPHPNGNELAYRHFHEGLGDWTPDDWRLPFAVYLARRGDGPAGCVANQSVGRSSSRSVGWSTPGRGSVGSIQGHGIGKEMRAAVLHFAFEGLGAATGPDRGVRRQPGVAAGHRVARLPADDGGGINVQRDHAQRIHRYALERDEWARQRRDDIAIEWPRRRPRHVRTGRASLTIPVDTP